MRDETERLALYSVNTRLKLNQAIKQRRYSVYNSYNQELSSLQSTDDQLTYIIFITPDFVSAIRWEYKFVVKDFIVPIQTQGVIIGDTSLTIEKEEVTNTPSEHTHVIQPNPHTHTASVTPGVSIVPAEADIHAVYLDGYDITKYLKQQFPLPNGSGMFPDETVEHRYDLLKAVSALELDGNPGAYSKIVKAGSHKLEVKANGLFQMVLREFMSYSFIVRQGDTATSDGSLKNNTFIGNKVNMTTNMYEASIEKNELTQELVAIENDPEMSNAQKLARSLTINTRLGALNNIIAIGGSADE